MHQTQGSEKVKQKALHFLKSKHSDKALSVRKLGQKGDDVP